MGVFKDHAAKYVAMGLSPLPIVRGEKRPAISNWQKYCTEPLSEGELRIWEGKYGSCNLGLALGSSVGTDALVAIDVDDDSLVDFVRTALASPPVGKRGKKGVTFLMLAGPEVQNQKIKRTDENGKPSLKPAVEVLARGSQTVLPPSVHPDGPEYTWVGSELSDPAQLPRLSEWQIDEIVAFCHGRGEHFANLNSMLWRGVGGGGDTHDSCVAAVACLVARGWTDNAIIARVDRAKRDAVLRAGEEYNWPDADRVIQGWIDSARDKGMDVKAKKPKSPPPERIMADWAIEKLGGPEKVASVQGVLRSYVDGHWPEVNTLALMKEMFEIEPMLKEREAKSALAVLATVTDRPGFGRTPGINDPSLDPKRSRVALRNGTFDLKTGRLVQWDPEHEILHQLPFDWDDEADCSLYIKVLGQTFNHDQDSITLWDEFCAHTLVDDMTFQKLLFLRGPGGNGKGTLARVLRDMHDPAGVGSVAITDLNDERKRTSLVGKLVNISGEQSRLNVVSDTYLKKITGGDPIDVRKLYAETRNNVVLSVRFLELVNEMPATSDSSFALRRRVIILDCPNRVVTPDPLLDHKLRQERAGILKRWAEALKRLYDRGHFYVPAKSQLEVEQYIKENNPVAIWLEEETLPLLNGDKGTPQRELYTHFTTWSKMMGFRWTPSGIEWGRKMDSAGFPPISKEIGGIEHKLRMVRVRAGREM